MKYDCRMIEGAVPPPYFPLDVLDADGRVIDDWIVAFDEQSGEVISQATVNGVTPLTGGEPEWKMALYPPVGINELPILIEDCPSIEFKSADGEVKQIHTKPFGKEDWEEHAMTETKKYKAPLRHVKADENSRSFPKAEPIGKSDLVTA